MLNLNVLIIGCVWPEPNSSAAGRNMLNLIEHFTQRKWNVTFACAAQPSMHAVDLPSLGVQAQPIALNDSDFDHWVKVLNPEIVVFDRFMTEEQYSWRVSQSVPTAIKILNTEDCHSLRFIRQKQLDEHKDVSSLDIAIREAAAILRSDLTLVVSPYEINWLHQYLSVPKSQIVYCPLLLPVANTQEKDYTHSRHVSFIGNFKHAPNWNAVLKLRTLWPAIRKQLGPNEECHVFGAYPPKKATDLTSQQLGFYVKGWIDNAEDAFRPYRVFAAPIQFGAGVKGKLLEAAQHLTPSVTTSLGCEGIASKHEWPGRIADDDQAFVDAVVELYNSSDAWDVAKNKAKQRVVAQADNALHFHQAIDHIDTTYNNLDAHRAAHMLSRVVNHQTLKSHQYMSQWIEAKNKLSGGK